VLVLQAATEVSYSAAKAPAAAAHILGRPGPGEPSGFLSIGRAGPSVCAAGPVVVAAADDILTSSVSLRSASCTGAGSIHRAKGGGVAAGDRGDAYREKDRIARAAQRLAARAVKE